MHTMIKTYLTITKKGEPVKVYFKNDDGDMALDLLKKSAFVQTTVEDSDKCFMQRSYENEVHQFVERLLDGISGIIDENNEIRAYCFEDSQDFDERHLLWGCFDLLIKADLTIKTIKESRMEILNEKMKLEFENALRKSKEENSG